MPLLPREVWKGGIMALMLSVHQRHSVAQLDCSHPASCRLSSRSCPQISLPQRARQRQGLCKPLSRNASNLIFCAASSQTMSAGSAKPLRFIQHKEEAFWFYRFLSIVYDHIGTQFFFVIPNHDKSSQSGSCACGERHECVLSHSHLSCVSLSCCSQSWTLDCRHED